MNPLSQAERKLFRGIFDSYDTNGDGSISAKELAAVLAKCAHCRPRGGG